MLRLDIIHELLPQKVWSILQVLVRTVTLVFFSCMFVSSLSLVAAIQNTARVSPALGIPYVYIYLSTVISFALAAVRSLQVLFRTFCQRPVKEEALE